MKIILTLTTTAIYFLCVATFAKLYVADVEYKSSRIELAKGNSTKAVEHAENAINLNPNEPAYYRARAKGLIASTINQEEKTKSTLKEWAHNNLETALALNPINLATIRNITPTYYFLAVDDLMEPNGLDNLDPLYTPVALEFIKNYKNYSPTDAGVYVLMAKYEKRLGNDVGHGDSIERINELRPDLLEWHPNLIN